VIPAGTLVSAPLTVQRTAKSESLCCMGAPE
jgi:hypothetical protein